jgi:hypothetical protein
MGLAVSVDCCSGTRGPRSANARDATLEGPVMDEGAGVKARVAALQLQAQTAQPRPTFAPKPVLNGDSFQLPDSPTDRSPAPAARPAGPAVAAPIRQPVAPSSGAASPRQPPAAAAAAAPNASLVGARVAQLVSAAAPPPAAGAPREESRAAPLRMPDFQAAAAEGAGPRRSSLHAEEARAQAPSAVSRSAPRRARWACRAVPCCARAQDERARIAALIDKNIKSSLPEPPRGKLAASAPEPPKPVVIAKSTGGPAKVASKA